MTLRHLICHTDDLKERGMGIRFLWQEGMPGFVVRVDGTFKAYVNSCPHRGTELDWEAGEVFDSDQESLVCATHGARFDPETGACLDGPCRGAGLKTIDVFEDNGRIYWSIDDVGT